MQNDMAVHSDIVYHIDACSGSGMLGYAVGIALELLGVRLQTVAHIEREAYAAATLVARMEDEALDQALVWDDITTAASPEFCQVVGRFRPLIFTAGYPCQPFSQAGKRLGEKDERHLWPYIDRLIGEVTPEVCFFENVSGHLRCGFGGVRRDLERRGYRVTSGLFSALEVGANHIRQRLFILAVGDTTSTRRSGRLGKEVGKSRYGSNGSSACLADSPALLGQEIIGGELDRILPLFAPGPADSKAWEQVLEIDSTVKPTIRRIFDGLAPGMDSNRIHLIGNGVVPLQAAYAFITLIRALNELIL